MGGVRRCRERERSAFNSLIGRDGQEAARRFIARSSASTVPRLVRTEPAVFAGEGDEGLVLTRLAHDAKKTSGQLTAPQELSVPVLFYGYHVLAAIAFLGKGELTHGPAKLAVISAAGLFGRIVNVRAHRPRLASRVLVAA